jgi:hypothetical protein
MAKLQWIRDNKGRWFATGTSQDYRIENGMGARTLHIIRRTGIAGVPFIRRAHMGTIAQCKARAEYLHNL